MIELVVHGVVRGQEISKYEQSDKFLEPFLGLFYGPHKQPTKTNIKRLPNNKMVYSYIVYENPGTNFLSYTGRPGSYFGMSLVVSNKQVANPDMLFKVLQATYENYVKNKIIQEDKSGTRKWLYPTLGDANDTVAKYISSGFESILKQNPGVLKFQPLPSLQKSGRDY